MALYLIKSISFDILLQQNTGTWIKITAGVKLLKEYILEVTFHQSMSTLESIFQTKTSCKKSQIKVGLSRQSFRNFCSKTNKYKSSN